MEQPAADAIDNAVKALQQMRKALNDTTPDAAQVFYGASQNAYHHLNDAVIEMLGPMLDSPAQARFKSGRI